MVRKVYFTGRVPGETGGRGTMKKAKLALLIVMILLCVTAVAFASPLFEDKEL